MACGCRPRPPDVKTSVANTLGTWKHTIVFAYKAIRYGRRSELPERRSAGYRTWKDRRKTGGEPTSKRLVIGHPATLPDARFPTDPDSRPMPTGNRHGIQNGFCKQGPGKSRLPMQPFPGPYFHAVNRVHTFGKVSSRSSSAIPISSPNSQSLSRAQRTTTAVREAATDDASDQPEAACSSPS